MSWLERQWGALLQVALDHGAPAAMAILLTALLLYPLYDFWRYGWVRKKEEIDVSLTCEAKRIYFHVFWNRQVLPKDANSEFSSLYQRWYGRHRYLPAILFVFLIAIVENYVLAEALIQVTTTVPKEAGKDPVLPATAAAIAGAYTFVTWDFFGRVQRRSLSTTDILRGALRLGIAIPIGLAFSALAPSVGPFMAFGIGVFPLETISTMLRRLVNDQLKLQLGADGGEDQLSKLAGIDRTIADRILDADVTTITQLAWCDPIQLIMRTSLSFDYVVDIVSQALAWSYLGDKLIVLRTYGQRGAYEISVLMTDIASADPKAQQMANETLSAAAAAVQLPVPSLTYTFERIAKDRATQFLCEAS